MKLSKLYKELLSEDTNGGNYGYHVGDLKEKSEFIGDKALGARQLATSGIGKASKTGQFGAGHFFFGSVDQAKEFQKQKNMPIYKVDFGQYNLYRPSNPKEFVESTIELTNALVMVPKGYSEDQEFVTLINDLSEDLPYFGINLSKEKIYEITKGFVYDMTTGSNSNGDYLITRYLKAVGYEGVDLRNTPYDSFFIGSVIYDIKPNTVSAL